MRGKGGKPPTQGQKQDVQITAQTIKAALTEADDFGHEMRLRNLLQQCGVSVDHVGSYIDPILGKPRLFDVRAEFKHQQYPWRMRFALEAKNISPQAPLVITGAARTKEAFHDVFASSGLGGTISHRGTYRVVHENRVYPRGEFVGKSAVRFKKGDGKLVPAKDPNADAYDNWSQALASADELCKTAVSGGRNGDALLTVIVPGVVLPDGTLWCAEYDKQARCMEPVESDSAAFYFNHEVVVVPNNHSMRISHVHFWTLAGLERFLRGIAFDGNTWDPWFQSNLVRYTPPVH